MTDPGARPSFEARLSDPGSHFPYKHDDALTGVHRSTLLEARSLELMTSDAEEELHAALRAFAVDEVDATAAYVAAQEAYLRAPSADTRAAERAAAEQLAAARRARREARPALVTDALTADAQHQEG